MSKAIVVRINETPFLIETDDSIELPPIRPSAVFKPVMDRTDDFEEVVDFRGVEQSFADIKRLIVTCCNSLHEAILEISNPEKMAIEFGIKLAGETGLPMITKASGEANFKISLEWKSPAGSTTEDR